MSIKASHGLLAEVHAAKLDAEKKPINDSNGFFATDLLLLSMLAARHASREKVSYTFTLKQHAAVTKNRKAGRTGEGQALARLVA